MAAKQIKPSLIDRIQDRYGKTIFRHEDRACENCNADHWEAQEEPVLIDNREQSRSDDLLSDHLHDGRRSRAGTAAGKIKLDRPVAGKTGTTNDEKDAWFVGYTPDLVAGLYLGFDDPARSGAGRRRRPVAPIFNAFMQKAVEGTRPGKFRGCRKA